MSDDRSGFDFDTAFEPERAPVRPVASPDPQATLDISSPRADQVAEPRSPSRSSSLGERRRGNGLSWLALGLAVVAAVGVGIGIFRALASIDFAAIGFGTARHWMTVVALSLCIALVALAVGIVAALRTRPRTLAGLAIAASVVLPLVAMILGTKLGLDVLWDHLHGDYVSAAQALRDLLAQQHVKISPLIDLLLRLVGG